MTIIIGAGIIGGFVYLGIKSTNVAVAPKMAPPFLTPSVSQKETITTNSVISTETATCGAANQTIVTKVIDGDTIVVEGGYHVRLLGMDADEKGYPCYEQAKTRLENLILGKNIILKKDVNDIDQYGRCLRYIFLGDENIDVQLVKEGLAVARFYPPDIKYKNEITEAEKQAQTNGIGCKWLDIH